MCLVAHCFLGLFNLLSPRQALKCQTELSFSDWILKCNCIFRARSVSVFSVAGIAAYIFVFLIRCILFWSLMYAFSRLSIVFHDFSLQLNFSVTWRCDSSKVKYKKGKVILKTRLLS